MSRSGTYDNEFGFIPDYDDYDPDDDLDFLKTTNAVTNYDHLISQTPEELAEWLNSIQLKARFYWVWSRDAWFDWLKQGVKK